MKKHPFRTNWWSHTCSDGTIIWKRKQYLHCDKCGYINGRTHIARKTI